MAQRQLPALDGVRGIAVLAVFLHHAARWPDHSWLARLASAGWMGVDLFFVLSGYLITGILMDARGSDAYLAPFYGRRLVRLMPALALFLVVVLYCVPRLPFALGGDVGAQGQSGWWYWLYGVNVLIALRGYRAPIAGTSHLWSLAVEEQFYFVWPWVIARCRRAESVMRVAAALIVAVFVARIVGHAVGSPVDGIYVLPVFRADALAWGALLAASQRREGVGPLTGRTLLLTLAAGATLLGVVAIRLRFELGWPSRSMQIVGYSATAMLCASLVGYASRHESRLLTLPPLRFMGKISYGFYLWHIPVILLLDRTTRIGGWSFAALALAGSLVPTMLSWRLVESPALRLKRYLPMAAGPAMAPAPLPAAARRV